MTSPVCGDTDTGLVGTPVNPCDREYGHAGDHRGYAPDVDEVIFWPPGPKRYWKLREDPNWRPYCLNCRTMDRMTPTVVDGADAFECQACGTVVDATMRPIKEPHDQHRPT